MTIEQLTVKENELMIIVKEVYNNSPTIELKNDRLKEVFAIYKEIHKNYADLSSKSEEALKRGLFIQWYVQTEPSFLTGIENIDQEAEQLIINNLEERIQNKSLDTELDWMLNYYAIWDFVFAKFKDKQGLQNLIDNKNNKSFPKTINRDNMKQRGQMGKYWNSLTIFR